MNTWRILMGIGIMAASATFAGIMPHPEAEQVAMEKQQRVAERLEIDALMESDGHGNSEWAIETYAALRQTLDEELSGGLFVQEFVCTQNYCRIVATHLNIEAQDEFLMGITGRPGFDQPGIGHLEYESDGSAMTYIYVRHPSVEWPSTMPTH